MLYFPYIRRSIYLFRMFWRKYRYSIFTCIIGGIFAIVIREHSESFFSWCSIFVAVWLSAHDILSDSRSQSISDEAQLLALLNTDNYPLFKNVIVKRRIKDIERMRKQLHEKVFYFNRFEMEEYTNECVRALSQNFFLDKWYYATHMVDSEKSLGEWTTDSLEQNRRDEFVQTQIALINSGGKVIRIFIFDKVFFEQNKESCKQMLLKHRAYYEGTSEPVITKACFHVSNHYDFKSKDLTVISNQFVFEWHRNSGTGNYDVGRCSISKSEFNDRLSTIKRVLELSGTKDMDNFINSYC